jgi:hypothetical protein
MTTPITPVLRGRTTRHYLSELYFTAITERETLRRTIQRTPEPTEHDVRGFIQINCLIEELRSILGTVITTVP